MSNAPPSRTTRPIRAVVAVCLAMAAVGINTTAIGVTTRGMAGELDVAADTMSWIVGAYLLTAASFSLVGGRLGDVAGRGRTFVVGLLTFAAGALLAAVSPSTGVLIAARAVEGLGAALVLPSSIELVVAHPLADGPRPGFKARGIVYASAFGVGPLVGGMVTDHVTWRAIFWLELAVLVIALVLVLPVLRYPSDLPRPATRDIRGALLSAALVATSLTSIARIPQAWGWWSWPMAVAVVIVAVLAVALVQVERRTDHPLLHGRALTDRVVAGANVATLAASIGMLGLLYFFNLFAQSAAVFDSPALAVAVTFIPFTTSIVLFAFIAARLSGRLGYRGPVMVGLGLATAGFFWLSTTSSATTEAQLVVPLALCGIGAGIANAGLTTPAVLTLPRTRLDEAAGLFSLSRYVGSALAIAIGTSTYLAVAATPQPVPATARVPPEEVAVGRTAFQEALDALDGDLRAPFEAAAREQSALGFASTMRAAGVALTVLTAASIVLLRPRPDDGDVDEVLGGEASTAAGGRG